VEKLTEERDRIQQALRDLHRTSELLDDVIEAASASHPAQ